MFIVMDINRSTSRRQGQEGDRLSEGSRSAKVRADEQKPHTRLSPWASQHDMTKPAGSEGRVNAAVVHGKFTFLSGETCLICDSVVMREIRNRFARLIKNPACLLAVNRHESLVRETQNKAATHDELCSALYGNVLGKQTGVSRGHSSCQCWSEGLNAEKKGGIQ